MTSVPQVPLTLETGRFSSELRMSTAIQNYILGGGELSPAGKATLQILEALIWGAKPQPTDETALFTMLGRLNGVSKDSGLKQVVQDIIPTVVLDTGVRTDHVLSGIAPAMALRAIPVMPSATPEQAIAAYTMPAVDGALSKSPDGVNILTLTPVTDSSRPTIAQDPN